MSLQACRSGGAFARSASTGLLSRLPDLPAQAVSSRCLPAFAYPSYPCGSHAIRLLTSPWSAASLSMLRMADAIGSRAHSLSLSTPCALARHNCFPILIQPRRLQPWTLICMRGFTSSSLLSHHRLRPGSCSHCYNLHSSLAQQSLYLLSVSDVGNFGIVETPLSPDHTISLGYRYTTASTF